MNRYIFFAFLLCCCLCQACNSDDVECGEVQMSDTITVASHRYAYSTDNGIRISFLLKKMKEDLQWRVMGEQLEGFSFRENYEYVLEVKSKNISTANNRRQVIYIVTKVLSTEQKESDVGAMFTPYTGQLQADGSVRDTITIASHHYTYRNHESESGSFLLYKPLNRGKWMPLSVLIEKFTHEEGYEYTLAIDSRPIETGYKDYPTVVCTIVNIIEKEQKNTQVPGDYVQSNL